MKVRARFEGDCECAHQVITIDTTEDGLKQVAEAWSGECFLCGAPMMFKRTKVKRFAEDSKPCPKN